MAEIKFLTEEEVAYEIEDDPLYSLKFLICAAMYNNRGWGGVLIHKFGEVFNYLKMSGAHFNGLLKT